MAEVTPADLRVGHHPSHYESSRALFDVLVGDDTALPLLEASSSGDLAALRKTLEEHPEVALESPHRIYEESRPAKDKDDVRRVSARPLLNLDQAIQRAVENSHAEAFLILFDFASRHSLQPSAVITRDTVKMALKNRDAGMFDVLATADPKIATRTDTFGMPIDMAINTPPHSIELIEVILKHGGGRPFSNPKAGNPLISYGVRGGSRLCEAAKKTKALTELLVHHGYPVKGSGALQGAAQSGKLDIVRFLVEAGADVNELLDAKTLPRVDNALYASWTPLHFAASHAREEAMQLLESYGARTDVLDVEGRTPLQLMQNWKDGKSYSKVVVR